MRHPIADHLATEPLIVLDGGLATELERRGADLADPLWSAKLLLEDPAQVRAVHRDYYRAGADVATTASYQASFEGLAGRGLDADAAARVMREAVALAIAAREDFWADEAARDGRHWPLVAASVGPYGAVLTGGAEYRGHYGLSVEALMDFHRPRLAVLAASGADVLACETIPCPEEAVALARLLPEFPALTAWISFSCRDERHVCQGEPLADAVAALDEAPQIAAVGVNCTAPQHVTALLESLRGVTAKPLLAYPNSGEVYDGSTHRWHGGLGCAHATQFAAWAREWHAAGARLIGGCCRTTPEDIAALRAMAAELPREAR